MRFCRHQNHESSFSFCFFNPNVCFVELTRDTIYFSRTRALPDVTRTYVIGKEFQSLPLSGNHGKRNNNPRFVGYRDEKYVIKFVSKTTHFRHIKRQPFVESNIDGFFCMSHGDICKTHYTHFLKWEMLYKICFRFLGSDIHVILTAGEDQLLNIPTVCLLNTDE